jgi:hypothetical protein
MDGISTMSDDYDYYNDYDEDGEFDDYDDYTDNFYECLVDDVTPFGKLRNMITRTYWRVKGRIKHRINFALSKDYRDHYDDIPF